MSLPFSVPAPWSGSPLPLYLRSDVVRGSTEGLGGDAIQHVFFAHAEIGDLDVALAVQHHVIQLQVPAGGKGNSFTCVSTRHLYYSLYYIIYILLYLGDTCTATSSLYL